MFLWEHKCDLWVGWVYNACLIFYLNVANKTHPIFRPHPSLVVFESSFTASLYIGEKGGAPAVVVVDPGCEGPPTCAVLIRHHLAGGGVPTVP